MASATMRRHFGFIGALLAPMILLPVGGAAAAPGSSGGSTPTIARADRVIRCETIDTERFCTELGFVDIARGSAAWDAQLQALLATPASDTGERSFAQTVLMLEALKPQEVAARQAEQIAQARSGVGLVRLVDALSGGEALPAGFFADHPALGVEEGSALAGVLREQAANPNAETLGQRLAQAGAVRTQSGTLIQAAVGSESTSAAAGAMAAAAVPGGATIMYGYYHKQDKSYYCGVATMQMIHWFATGVQLNQTSYWAPRLNTTTAGTALSDIVLRINTDTNLDTAHGGSYSMVSIIGHDLNWFRTVNETRIGVYGAPIVEHVMLKRAYYTYLKYDHGGHFQVGRGYSNTDDNLYVMEPYNERDWSSTGNVTGTYQSVPFANVWNATQAHSHKNFGA